MTVRRSQDTTAVEVEALQAMDKRALLKIWSEVFQATPHHTLRKELIVPILAYRLQEAVHGGLSNTARRKLISLRKTSCKTQASSAPSGSSELSHSTKLVRTWGGESHEVVVTESGFLYRGEIFKTLSPIAKRITGTQWSGPAFFGTQPKERGDV
jgi:hypothetical protein